MRQEMPIQLSRVFYVVRPVCFGIWGILILQKCVVEESNIKPQFNDFSARINGDQGSHEFHASHVPFLSGVKGMFPA